MRQYTKTAACFLLNLISVPIAIASPCSNNACAGRVASMIVNGSGNIYVALALDASGTAGLSACTPIQNEGVSFFTLDSKSTNFAEMHQTMLGAELMNRSITLSFKTGPQLGCVVSYVTI